MRAAIIFGALTTAVSAMGKTDVDFIVETITGREFFGVDDVTAISSMVITPAPDMQPTTTTTPDMQPTTTTTPDPWQCATETLSKYFDAPIPTGSLLAALQSYGDELLAPCLSTAIGTASLSCSVSDTSQWCGFTTFAPSPVLPDYSSYASAASSWWESESSTAVVLASYCPQGWARASFFNHVWVSLAVANGGCCVTALPSTKPTDLPAPTTPSVPNPPASIVQPSEDSLGCIIASSKYNAFVKEQ
jgi:hypothetical protein